MNKHRAIAIIVTVVVVVLVALAVFYFFFKRQGEVYQPNDTFPPGGEFPTASSSVPTQGSSDGSQSGGGLGGGSVGSDYTNTPQTYERLRLISSLPVAGGTLFTKNGETLIRYVERATGHIYEASTAKADAPHRLSNTTIPKIYESTWVQGGAGVILRYLKEGSDTAQTFYARLGTATSSVGEISLSDGTFLPAGTRVVSVSPSQDKIFYLTESGGEVFGIRANPNDTQKAQLFDSFAREWLAQWPQSTTISLTTKPSGRSNGYLYFLNATNGSLRRVLGDIVGLTTLVNGTASTVLYGQTTLSGVTLRTFDVATAKTGSIQLATLPEKCVWSRKDKTVLYCAVPDNMPEAIYPDAWYQGMVTFNDQVWMINTKTGETSRVFSPAELARRPMDITNLVLSDDERYVLFMDKKDLSLWLFDLVGK